MAPKPILELRHVECEPPAAYTPVLTRYAPVVTARVWREPVPADPADYSAIIVMGGPMGANDGPQLLWIDDEIDFLRRALGTTPIWGVCLGSQLLAAALGARVYVGDVPEVGVVEHTFTEDAPHDPVWGDHADSTFPALQWHSDSFDLPSDATLLASTPAYRNQLFRSGDNYGIQFHLEADEGLAREWLEIEEYRTALESAVGTEKVPTLLDEIAAAQETTVPLAHNVIENWLRLVL